MFLSERITIPANTTSTAPVVYRYKVEPTMIYFMSVFFPTGCEFTTHVKISANEHSVFPSLPDKDVSADGIAVEGFVFHEFTSGEAYIKIEGWNDSKLYSHTVALFAVILDKKYILPQEEAVLSLNRFLQMFRLRG
jgi:hypothetical protein